MQVGHDSVFVGATLGLTSMAVPDEIVSLAGKILVGVIVAMLTGLAHSAGKALWRKLTHKTPKPPVPPSPSGPNDNDLLN